jgi:hypothetical protein
VVAKYSVAIKCIVMYHDDGGKIAGPRERDMLKSASIAVAVGLLGVSGSSAQTFAPACSPIEFPPKCDTWSAAIRDPQTLKQSKQGTICHWYSTYTKKAGYCCENPIVGANGIGTALKCTHKQM